MSRSNKLVATLVLVAITVAIAVAAFVASPRASVPPEPGAVASPTPTATSAPSASQTAAAQLSPSPTPPGTHENLVLGYRITLPDRYRRGFGVLVTAPGDTLGVDVYTIETEQEGREACRQDAGHTPRLQDLPDIRVAVSRNPRGLSAYEWATTPREPGGYVLSTQQKVEPATIGVQEAVRLVEDNVNASTTAFVVRGANRMYEISATQSSSSLPRTWLDGVARTFVVVAPQPFPSATATVAPQVGAREIAQRLAAAFAAKDADAVARLMPECWISVVYAIDGVVPGQGPLNRSVFLFTPLLHQRFTAGTLSVTVDPALQQRIRGTEVEYFVRSEWREPDRAVRVDLVLGERDGRWMWTSAVHHYTEAQRGCIEYRSPWVSGTASC